MYNVCLCTTDSPNLSNDPLHYDVAPAHRRISAPVCHNTIHAVLLQCCTLALRYINIQQYTDPLHECGLVVHRSSLLAIREMQNLSAEQMSNSPPKSIIRKIGSTSFSVATSWHSRLPPRGNFLPHKLAQPINSKVIINLATCIHGYQTDGQMDSVAAAAAVVDMHPYPPI